MNTVEQRAVKLIAMQQGFDVSDVTVDKKFEDLSADSLDIIEIVMAVEDEFDIELSDSETDNLTTVQDLINLIQARIVK